MNVYVLLYNCWEKEYEFVGSWEASTVNQKVQYLSECEQCW